MSDFLLLRSAALLCLLTAALSAADTTSAVAVSGVAAATAAEVNPLDIVAATDAKLKADNWTNLTTVQRQQYQPGVNDWLTKTYQGGRLSLAVKISDVRLVGDKAVISFTYNNISYTGSSDLKPDQATRIERGAAFQLQARIAAVTIDHLGDDLGLLVPEEGLILSFKIQAPWHVAPPQPAAAVKPVAAAKSATKPVAAAVPPAKSRRIAYVVQRSGAMSDAIGYVKQTLNQSLPKLNPEDQFYLSFYSSRTAFKPFLEVDQQWLFASEENKRRALRLVDSIIAIGTNDPTEALRRAFALKPDMIYFLSNGEFGPDIPVLIDKLNAKHEVTVNTVNFVYTDGEATLKMIAEKNRGTYLFVGDNDLKKLPVLAPASDTKPVR